MSNKKLFNDKTAKGIVSLITIIVVLSSILAVTIFYENNITANVVKETNNKKTSMQIQSVYDANELSQLNEGWYLIRNGFVYYLDTFDSYVPLWIKVKNPEQKNGLFVVDADGSIRFEESYDGLEKGEWVLK